MCLQQMHIFLRKRDQVLRTAPITGGHIPDLEVSGLEIHLFDREESGTQEPKWQVSRYRSGGDRYLDQNVILLERTRVSSKCVKLFL